MEIALKITTPWEHHIVHQGHLECCSAQAYKQRQSPVSFLSGGKSNFGLDFETDGEIW